MWQELLILLLVSDLTDSQGQMDSRGFYTYRWMALTDVPDDIPLGAVSVDLDGNEIAYIPKGAFHNLSGCTALSLAWNLVTDIEPGAFEGLENIQTMTIFQNRLPELKAGMFLGLDSLQKLILSNNNINRVEAGSWQGLHNLKKLYLYANWFTELKANMFAGLDSLDELTLTFNLISAIEPGSFVGLGKLEKLWLDNNNVLTHLDKDMFMGLDSLYRMSIHTNNIERISDGVFTGLKNLVELDVDDNKISALTPDVFHGLNKLTRVWLYNNNLTTIPASVFPNLPRPLDITIGGNPLQCDKRLCWIKQAEKEGWLRWIQFETRPLEPNCTSGTPWSDLVLDCTGPVECPDPGGIHHGVREESHWPYTPTSTITYSCLPCYSGGGTLTCQGDGTWSQKPKCKVITCPEPDDLDNAQRAPSGPMRIQCGRHVTYFCNQGYELQGNASRYCHSNGKLTGKMPYCRKLPSDITAVPQTAAVKTTTEHDSWKWIPIAIGCFMFVIIVVVIVLFILRRRGIYFCYKRPGPQRMREEPADDLDTSRDLGASGGATVLASGGGFVNKAALDDGGVSFIDLKGKEGMEEGLEGVEGVEGAYPPPPPGSPPITPAPLGATAGSPPLSPGLGGLSPPDSPWAGSLEPPPQYTQHPSEGENQGGKNM